MKVPDDVVKAACDRYLKNGKPTNRPEILADSDFDIVFQYQWHYAGLVNYYLLAQNVANFGKLHYIMQTSLLKTLANKHRKSVAFMWRKYKNTVRTPVGPRRCIKVVIERPDKLPLTAIFGGLSLRRQVKAVLKDYVPIRRPRRTEILKRLLANACEVCNSSNQVEVHHVRKLSDLQKMGRKALPDWAKIMIARKRKTLVLCKSCHMAVHAGRPLPQMVSI